MLASGSAGAIPLGALFRTAALTFASEAPNAAARAPSFAAELTTISKKKTRAKSMTPTRRNDSSVKTSANSTSAWPGRPPRGGAPKPASPVEGAPRRPPGFQPPRCRALNSMELSPLRPTPELAARVPLHCAGCPRDRKLRHIRPRGAYIDAALSLSIGRCRIFRKSIPRGAIWRFRTAAVYSCHGYAPATPTTCQKLARSLFTISSPTLARSARRRVSPTQRVDAT